MIGVDVKLVKPFLRRSLARTMMFIRFNIILQKDKMVNITQYEVGEYSTQTRDIQVGS